MYYFKPIVTVVGELKLVASDRGLVGILWENDDPKSSGNSKKRRSPAKYSINCLAVSCNTGCSS
jgi:hypothetical protein